MSLPQSPPSPLAESWARIAPRAAEAAHLFYERLFALSPDVRVLFPKTDGGMMALERKFAETLLAIVESAEEPERLLPMAAALGRRHVGYGTLDAHYDVVGRALLWALDTLPGLDLTQDERRAWTETYALVAAMMQRAARRKV